MGIEDFMTGLAGFLATYLLHGTVFLGGVMLLDYGRRVRSGTLEALYRTALVAPVATALLSMNLSVQPLAGTLHWFEAAGSSSPALVEPRPPAAPLPGAAEVSASVTDGQAAPTGAASRDAGTPASATAPGAGMGLPAFHARDLVPAAGAAWLLVSVLLTLRWLGGARAGRRLLSGRRRLTGGPAHRMLCRLADSAGRRPPDLSVCDALGGPATLPGGEICLPRWALSLPADQLEAMLAHELAHVERRDPWWLAAAVSLEAVFWLQPLNRFARRRLADLAELHADARAARLTRDGRALAQCLAECAERIHAGRMPVLAAAMARRGGALSERVSKLVNEQTETGGISMSRKIGILGGALALVLVLPSVAVMANKGGGDGGTSVSIHRDGDGPRTMKVSFSEDGARLELEASGDLVFAPDDSGLEHMGPGAELKITRTVDGVTRKLLAEGGDDGDIAYTYFVDGEQRPFDAEAQAWLAEIMPMVMRETAINAPERVEYILANAGHDGVLDEIGLIHSDFARRHYIEAYVMTGPLPGDAYDRLIEEAARIGSDFETRNALGVIYDTQSPRGKDLADLIAVAGEIGSDFELRQILGRLAKDAVADESVMAAYAKAAEGIGSDFELRQALEALMEAGGGPRGVIIALPVAEGISSDFEMRSLLEEAASEAAGDEEASRVWLEAAATIGSDFELAQALTEFANEKPSSAATWQALLETARGIGSDHECARFLVDAAASMPDDPAVERAFRSVMETIGSDSDYRRVAKAIDG